MGATTLVNQWLKVGPHPLPRVAQAAVATVRPTKPLWPLITFCRSNVLAGVASASHIWVNQILSPTDELWFGQTRGRSPRPSRSTVEVTAMEALVHSIADACAVARVGKTALYEAINSGKLPARKRGRRTLILGADLRQYLEKLPLLVPAKCPAQDQGAT